MNEKLKMQYSTQKCVLSDAHSIFSILDNLASFQYPTTTLLKGAIQETFEKKKANKTNRIVYIEGKKHDICVWKQEAEKAYSGGVLYKLICIGNLVFYCSFLFLQFY